MTHQSDLVRRSRDWPTWTLTPPQIANLYLLLTGALSPLSGFMTQAEAELCATAARLPEGTYWPAPIVLDVPESIARSTSAGSDVALVDAEGLPLAALHVTDVWTAPDRAWRLGGSVEEINRPFGAAFVELQRPANEVRQEIASRGSKPIVAFMPTDFVRRAELESILSLPDLRDATLLLLPMATMRSPDDLDYFTRVRAFRALRDRFPRDIVMSLLPNVTANGSTVQELALRFIVARNHGAARVVVSEGALASTTSLRPPLDAAASAIAVKLLVAPRVDPDGVAEFPDVAREISVRYPPRRQQGVTIFLTGLSGSGKSTIAKALTLRLMDRDRRRVTLLDGDLVRRHLSSELGFSREHRDLNVRRIGFVAAEITKHGGIAICAPIAPYASTRTAVRESIEPFGGFCLIHVDAPLAVCEQRDRKGLYAKARAGLIPQFTGVSDPYEAPIDADLVIKTAEVSVDEAVDRIMSWLETHGFLDPRPVDANA